MSNLYESTYYDVSWRGILFNKKNFKLYTNSDNINITSELSFDINADYKSSLNYFASSILGGIVHSLLYQSEKNNIIIEELEGKIHISLKNPLTLLGVKGYNDEPKIDSCKISIYLYAEHQEEELINFCKNSLKNCFIFNTLKTTIEFDINFSVID